MLELKIFSDEDIIAEVGRRQNNRGFEDAIKDELMIEDCENCEDKEVSDFDDEDLIDVLENRGYIVRATDNIAPTIRDEQYEEIFEQLKEKYSVSELQRLLA